MSERPLDLRASAGVVWRRKATLALVVALGLAGGIGYGVLRPPSSSASALVLLAPSPVTTAGTPTRDLPTEVLIATSTPVLGAAGRTLRPEMTALELKQAAKVSTPSQDVLEIKAHAPSPAVAEAIANAVARSFVSFVQGTTPTANASTLGGLQKQATILSSQAQDIADEIAAVRARLAQEPQASAQRRNDIAMLSWLESAQTATAQLTGTNNQVLSAETSNTTAASPAASLLQPAALAPSSVTRLAVMHSALGVLVGLAFGAAFVLIRYRRDRRLRLRDEVASAIGVPVLASLEAEECKSAEAWSSLFDKYRPASVDAWSMRRVLYRIAPVSEGKAPVVRVVSLADDRAALSAGPQLAVFAASLGMTTKLEVGDHEALIPLRAAYATDREPGAGRRGDEDRGSGGPHLSIEVVAVDAAKPEVPPGSGRSVLAVSSGFATADVLARVALAATDIGDGIEGILVVNPESTDTTTGSLSEGAVTSDRLRAARPLRPAPVTGESR